MENWSTKSPERSFRVSHAPYPTLPDSFYLQDAVTVGRSLLGKGLLHRVEGRDLLVELVEVEAYLGDEDPASHAYRRRTPRNRLMFERGGACYVYLSYGMNFCMNVVTGPEELGQAVLLRAGAPIEGEDPMRKNRGLTATADRRKIASSKGLEFHYRFSVRASKHLSRKV